MDCSTTKNPDPIVDFYREHADARGIPTVSYEHWVEFAQQYDKQQAREALARYIHGAQVAFPLAEIEQIEFQDLFQKFCATSMLDQYRTVDTVLEKFDYRYRYQDRPLGVIDKSHAYNAVSNYFQQANRMRCGSNKQPSPWTYWHDPALLAKMNWHMWRIGALAGRDISAATFREAFRIGTYTATQFKPSVAKAIYERHGARRVLDTSSGWGDRLAGFYATPCTTVYVGMDPNPEVYATYKQQCVTYERLLGAEPVLTDHGDHFECQGAKSVTIWNLPSEDIPWHQYQGCFDFYFTSPPYFETERYAAGTGQEHYQSWQRYPSFDAWKHDFFFAVNRWVWSALEPGGWMMINIIEPGTGSNARMSLCDDMVDDILTYPDAHYIGKLGMRMQARPHNIVSAEKNAVFVEPIWVFRRGTAQYDTQKSSTFESLFDYA